MIYTHNCNFLEPSTNDMKNNKLRLSPQLSMRARKSPCAVLRTIFALRLSPQHLAPTPHGQVLDKNLTKVLFFFKLAVRMTFTSMRNM